MTEIRVEEVPARLVAVTAGTPDGAPEAVERCIAVVAAAVQRAGGVIVGAPFVWVGGAAHVADLVVGIPVAGLRLGELGDRAADAGAGDDPVVEVVARRGGLAAVARHVGGPETLAAARRELAAWLDVRQLDAAAESWEEHLGAPGADEDPARSVTRLVRPLG